MVECRRVPHVEYSDSACTSPSSWGMPSEARSDTQPATEVELVIAADAAGTGSAGSGVPVDQSPDGVTTRANKKTN